MSAAQGSTERLACTERARASGVHGRRGSIASQGKPIGLRAGLAGTGAPTRYFALSAAT